MPVFNNILAGASGSTGGAADPLEIKRSLRFNTADSSFLEKTFSSAGNRKKWTWSGWVKKSEITDSQAVLFSAYGGSGNAYLALDFRHDQPRFINWNGSSVVDEVKALAKLRDPSAWYHIIWAVDTDQSTDANKVKLYINGVRQTQFETANYPGTGDSLYISNNIVHEIGRNVGTSQAGFNGYLAEVHFVDGQELDETSFGAFDSTTGVWNPITFSGSHGSNGFYLDFADNSSDSALGNDAAGSNNWSVYNLASGATVANKGFDCFTYTGTNATQAFTNLAFQPDFLWFKSTSRQDSYGLYDVVRGRASNLYSDLNHSANTSATSADLVSFDSNGFTLGQVQQTALNRTSEDYVVWAWKAGGTPSTLNTGSISASVSANTAYGFSIVKYTGDGTTNASVAHGLGSTPKMVIVKNLATGDWKVRHTSLASTYMATLNENYLANTASWNGETSSVFYPARSGDNYLNANTEEYIAYCWSEISGFSKFGSWAGTGNGGSSGPVITLGFKPRWVLFKRTDQSGDNWTIFDTARDSGTLNMGLQPNVDLVEQNFGNREILVSDTGFQVRSTGSSSNQAGGTYIYAAFAEGDSSIIDSLIDSPTNYEANTGNNGGNYCTLNSLDQNTATLTDGNLKAQVDTDGARFVRGTIAVSSGKWFWEYTTKSGTSMALGVVETTGTGNLTHSQSYYYYANNGTLYGNSTGKNGSFSGSGLVVGDVLGVALDMDNGTLQYYKNGSLIGTAWTGLTGKTVAPAIGNGGGGPNITACNFGQRPFAISSVPTGYKALCTKNLDDAVYAPVLNGSAHFAANTWIIPSNNADTTVSGLKFGPDWLLLKNRSASSEGSAYDRLLGDDKYLKLFSTNNGSDPATTATTRLNFTNDGYVLEGGNDNANYGAGQLGVGWAWNAGTTNTSSSAGSLNSSVYTQDATYAASSNFSGSTTNVNFNNMFNGIIGNENVTGAIAFSQYGNSLEMTWTAPSTITNITSLRIYIDFSGTATDGAFEVNGTSYRSHAQTTLGAGNDGWVTISETSLSTIKIGRNSNNTVAVGVGAVEVNGKILIDTGVTPPNFPSIASTYRANPAAGFSIVKYTGNSSLTQTLAHGLNRVPELIIGKNTGSTLSWPVYTKGTTAAGYLKLNTTAAYTGSTGVWGNKEPTSSVFYVGNDADMNQANVEHLAYCFAPIPGFSSFGTYDGNSSSDGPFVNTGFRPAFILLKNQGSAIRSWEVYDSTRDPINVGERSLLTNDSANESSGSERVDFLSNGFKIRTSANGINAATPIFYAAFAENPFKISRAR